MPDSNTAGPKTCEKVMDALCTLRDRCVKDPTIERIAAVAGTSKRQVSRALNTLEADRRIARNRIEILDGGKE